MRSIAGLGLGCLIALGVSGAPPAVAQSEEIYRAQAGRWLIAARTGEPGCVVTLGLARAIGGRAIEMGQDCAKRLPVIANAAAWAIADGVILRDATRRTIARFSEDETAIWTERNQDLLMVPLTQGVDRLPVARAVFGAWTMRRPGGPAICEVTFLDRAPPGGQESFALTLRPGCDAAVTRLKFASWRIEGPNLMLYGNDGESLGFELTASGFAKRKAEGGRPLLMEKAR
jgi:hypothetical protein